MAHVVQAIGGVEGESKCFPPAMGGGGVFEGGCGVASGESSTHGANLWARA